MCQGEWSTVQKQLALKQLHLLMPLNTDTVCVSMQAVHVCALAFHRMSSNRVLYGEGVNGRLRDYLCQHCMYRLIACTVWSFDAVRGCAFMLVCKVCV